MEGKIKQSEFTRRLKEREEEYKGWLQRKILAEDAKFREHEKYTSKVTPIRKPKAHRYDFANREYYWNDALWCGDISTCWPEEFLDVGVDWSDDARDFAANEEYQQLCNELFNEVFRKVMPESLHHCLEG